MQVTFTCIRPEQSNSFSDVSVNASPRFLCYADDLITFVSALAMRKQNVV